MGGLPDESPEGKEVSGTGEISAGALRRDGASLDSLFSGITTQESGGSETLGIQCTGEGRYGPGNRQSSITTEPLTLDVETMHDAKEVAVGILQSFDVEEASNIFTKDASAVQIRQDMAEAQEKEVDALATHINKLVEKAQVVVEANEKQASAVARIPGATSSES